MKNADNDVITVQRFLYSRESVTEEIVDSFEKLKASYKDVLASINTEEEKCNNCVKLDELKKLISTYAPYIVTRKNKYMDEEGLLEIWRERYNFLEAKVRRFELHMRIIMQAISGSPEKVPVSLSDPRWNLAAQAILEMKENLSSTIIKERERANNAEKIVEILRNELESSEFRDAQDTVKVINGILNNRRNEKCPI